MILKDRSFLYTLLSALMLLLLYTPFRPVFNVWALDLFSSAHHSSVQQKGEYEIHLENLEYTNSSTGLSGTLFFKVVPFHKNASAPVINVNDFGARLFDSVSDSVLCHSLDSDSAYWRYSLKFSKAPGTYPFGISAGSPLNSEASYFYRNLVINNTHVRLAHFSPGPAKTELKPLPVLSDAALTDASAALTDSDSGDTRVSALSDTFNVSGHITYWNEPSNSEKAFSSIEVKIWDKDSFSTDDLLATFTTDQTGYYNVVNLDVNDPDEGGAVDLYISVTFDFQGFSIENEQAAIYEITTSPLQNISAGNYTVNIDLNSSSTLAPLGCIYTALNDSVQFLSSNLAFSRDKIKIVWPSAETTNYKFGYSLPAGTIVSERINVAPYSQWSSASVMHEYGHAVMMHLYGYNYNKWPVPAAGGSPSPHYVNSLSSPEFALKEGFAEFFPCMIMSSAYELKEFSNADTPNAETNEWWKGQAGTNLDGSVVEGSVASIFWDMYDTSATQGAASPDDDSLSNQHARIFTILSEYTPSSITAFWDAWLEKGFGSVYELKAVFDANRVSVSMPSNNVPTIMVTSPLQPQVPANPFNITWNSYDGDGDTLKIDLFYDNDNQPGSEILIAADLADTGIYSWNFSSVPAGVYYIKALAKDNKGGSGADWSSGTVSLNFNGNPPIINPVIPSLYAVKNQPVIIDLTEYESDTEDGTPSESLVWSVSHNDNCTVSGENSIDDIITITPAADFTGCDSVYFILTDSGGKTASQAVDIIWTDSALADISVNNYTFAYAAHPSYPLSDLGDGQTGYQTDFASYLGSAESAEMILDLGENRVVTGLVIFNDGEYGARNAQIELARADSSSDFRPVKSFSDLAVTQFMPNKNTLYLQPSFGRYLKIIFSGFHSSGWFQLNEIEVKGFKPVSPGPAQIQSITSTPAPVSGRGADLLIDSRTVLNGDYAVINDNEKVSITIDFGQTTEIFGIDTVTDSIYGASDLSIYASPDADFEKLVKIASFSDIKSVLSQVTPNPRYFNMVSARLVNLEFTGFSDNRYFQLNEITFYAQGAASGSGITALDIQTAVSSAGSFPGYSISRIHDKVKSFNNDFVVKNSSTGVEILIDLGADKYISEIRHYNDGQYGASGARVQYALQASSSYYTDLGTFNNFGSSPGVTNQNILSFQQIQARYLKFTYTSFYDPVWFQLNEIELYGSMDQGSGSENKIDIKSAVSSAASWPGYDESKLYNGLKVYNSDFAALNPGTDTSIILDMGSDRAVNTVKIFNDGLFGAKSVQLLYAPASSPSDFQPIRSYSPLKAQAEKCIENTFVFNEITARYLKLNVTEYYNSSWFQLNEIELYKSSQTASGIISASGVTSNITPYPGFGLAKLIDGMKNYNSDFAVKNSGSPLYLVFDLGNDYTITSFAHTNDGEYGAKSVLVKYSRSESPDVFITVKTFTGLSVTPGSPCLNNLVFDQAVTGRYIKLEYSLFNDPQWFQLNEMEFYGSLAAPESAFAAALAGKLFVTASIPVTHQRPSILPGALNSPAGTAETFDYPAITAETINPPENIAETIDHSVDNRPVPEQIVTVKAADIFRPVSKTGGPDYLLLHPGAVLDILNSCKSVSNIHLRVIFTNPGSLRLSRPGQNFLTALGIKSSFILLSKAPVKACQFVSIPRFADTLQAGAEHISPAEQFNPGFSCRSKDFYAALADLENYIDLNFQALIDYSISAGRPGIRPQALNDSIIKKIKKFINKSLYCSDETELLGLWKTLSAGLIEDSHFIRPHNEKFIQARACPQPRICPYLQALLYKFMILPNSMEAQNER